MSKIYYKTKKTSDIGKAIAELWEKGEKADEAGRVLAEKYNADVFFKENSIAFGGISGFVFSETPNPDIWKKVSGYEGYFMPKRSTKKGKMIDDEMSAIPTIRIDDFSDLLPNKPPVFGRMGVVVNEEDVYVAILSEWKIKLPEEFTEVCISEWEKITQERTVI